MTDQNTPDSGQPAWVPPSAPANTPAAPDFSALGDSPATAPQAPAADAFNAPAPEAAPASDQITGYTPGSYSAAPQAPVTPQYAAPETPSYGSFPPPTQQYAPPAQGFTPPQQQYTPPAQQYTPPAQQYTPPGQTGYAAPAFNPTPYTAPAQPQAVTWPPTGQAPVQPDALQPYYADAAAPAKKSKLGLIGLIIVAVGAIAGCFATWSFGAVYAQVLEYLVNSGAVISGGQIDVNSLPLEVQEYFGTYGMLYLTISFIASLVGIVGFVISIIAAVQNKGRPQGIVGIILGVLAPILMFVVFMAQIMQFATALAG